MKNAFLAVLLLVGCGSTPDRTETLWVADRLKSGTEQWERGSFEYADASLREAYAQGSPGFGGATARAQAALLLGYLHNYEGRFDESLAWHRRSTAEGPTRFFFWSQWGQAITLEARGDRAEADRVSAEALLFADEPWLIRRRFGCVKGVFLASADQNAAAFAAFDAALARIGAAGDEPAAAQCHVQYAHALLEAGEPARAITHYRIVIDEKAAFYRGIWEEPHPFRLVPLLRELHCAYQEIGDVAAANRTEAEIRRYWAKAAGFGYDRRSPYFQPSHVRACARHPVTFAGP